MTRRILGSSVAMVLGLAVSIAVAAPRGEAGGERSRGGATEGREGEGNRGAQEGREEPGRGANQNQAPGGEWSQRTHSGKQSTPPSTSRDASNAPTGYAAEKNPTQTSMTQGKTTPPTTPSTTTPTSPQYSAAQGAAAGAAVANSTHPTYVVTPGATGVATTVPGAAPMVPATMPMAPGAMPATGAQYPTATQYPAATVGPQAGTVTANYPSATMPAASVSANAATTTANVPPMTANAPTATANVPSTMSGVAADYANVRNSLNQSPVYSQQWCLDHPGSWFPTGWVPKAAWNATSWDALANLCSLGNVAPISYDYGVNVTAMDGSVYVNGQNVGTTAAFSQQAADAAWAGAGAEVSTADEWLPLGVFAMVRNERQQPQLIVQLAINKQGVLRGNYTDTLTDHDSPIRGAIDKRSQRAAWVVGDNKQAVMEVGLKDLTDSEAPALIHKGGKTDHWLLIRLVPPQMGPN